MKGDKRKIKELSVEQLDSKIAELETQIAKERGILKTGSKKTHLPSYLRKQLSRAYNFKHAKTVTKPAAKTAPTKK